MRRAKPQFILQAILPVILTLAQVGRADDSDKTFTRQVMLKAMAQNCIVPGMIEIATNAEELFLATQRLTNEPSQTTLAQAREAWTKMQLAYKRNEMLTYGPVENQIFWQANFFQQIHPGLTQYTIIGNEPIDQNLVEKIGGEAKGFLAVRYLLFSSVSDQMEFAGLEGKDETNSFVSWFLQGKTAVRRRQYLCAIAQNLSQHLREAARKAQDTNFPATFAAGGQDSANLLVNQLIVTLESSVVIPLQNALNPALAKRPGLTAEKLAGMKASLDGLHRFYRGANGVGLDVYLQHINPGLHDRLEAQFGVAVTTLAVLDKPIEMMDAARRPPVEKAREEAHKLELLLKVDLVSALGVTIMFHAYDGD